MAMPLHRVRALTDAEVEEHYDETARSTQVGLSFWRDELERRSRERLIKSNQKLTWLSLGLAALSTIASVAAVFLAIVTLAQR